MYYLDKTHTHTQMKATVLLELDRNSITTQCHNWTSSIDTPDIYELYIQKNNNWKATGTQYYPYHPCVDSSSSLVCKFCTLPACSALILQSHTLFNNRAIQQQTGTGYSSTYHTHVTYKASDMLTSYVPNFHNKGSVDSSRGTPTQTPVQSAVTTVCQLNCASIVRHLRLDIAL